MHKCYYAHPLSLYGSPQETADVAMLEGLGFEVINPNSEYHSQQYSIHGMQYFCDVVNACDMLAFRAFPDGSIPAGIAKEVSAARMGKKPVIELPNGIIRRCLSVEESVEYLEQSGQRAPKY